MIKYVGDGQSEMQMPTSKRVHAMGQDGRPHPHAWTSTNGGTGGRVGPCIAGQEQPKHARKERGKKALPTWPERSLVEGT